MHKFAAFMFTFAVCLSAGTVAMEQVLNMDDEPHYSRIFGNEYCRAYVVSLGRLEETKPVAHEHDWVRMTLGGTVEQAWGGTVFGSTPYEDPEGYEISFLFPINRLSLRNSHTEPYRGLVVEIMQGDESRNRWRDPSLDPFSQRLGPGVDPHASYVTTLTKTSVEIVNVQLVGGDSKDLRSTDTGALLIAMTELNMSYKQENADAKELQLSKGDVKWLSSGRRRFKNLAGQPGRFVLLEMK
jgi:hypothetical protein